MRSILVENGERATACMYEFADEVVYMCDYNEYHYYFFFFSITMKMISILVFKYPKEHLRLSAKGPNSICFVPSVYFDILSNI